MDGLQWLRPVRLRLSLRVRLLGALALVVHACSHGASAHAPSSLAGREINKAHGHRASRRRQARAELAVSAAAPHSQGSSRGVQDP